MKANPLMDLSPAEIDVLDDMIEEWNDRARRAQLNGSWGYGPKKYEALTRLNGLVSEAWKSKVNSQNVEEVE